MIQHAKNNLSTYLVVRLSIIEFFVSVDPSAKPPFHRQLGCRLIFQMLGEDSNVEPFPTHPTDLYRHRESMVGGVGLSPLNR